jgi:hypothetical protein
MKMLWPTTRTSPLILMLSLLGIGPPQSMRVVKISEARAASTATRHQGHDHARHRFWGRGESHS